ncbi:MAG: cytochrome c [Candidatus Dadabacteria bacterium]|nr:cytochrome c [Candidatus Dadabacteria bacterium]
MNRIILTLLVLISSLSISLFVISCTKQEEEKKEEIVITEPKEETNPITGKAIYYEKCANCHGPTGHGDGPQADFLNPKPTILNDAKYMSTLTDEHMFKTISEGGLAVGKSNLMPRWKFVLTKDDIWSLIAYIRQSLCKCEYKEN